MQVLEKVKPSHPNSHPHSKQMEQMQIMEKELVQLKKDREEEHAQLRKSREALVQGHLAETEALRAEMQQTAGQKDKALREQAERSAGEIRTEEQLPLPLPPTPTPTLTPTLP